MTECVVVLYVYLALVKGGQMLRSRLARPTFPRLLTTRWPIRPSRAAETSWGGAVRSRPPPLLALLLLLVALLLLLLALHTGVVSALQPPVTFLHLAEARSLRLGSQRHICANPIIKRCVPESRHIDAQDVHVWDGSIGVDLLVSPVGELQLVLAKDLKPKRCWLKRCSLS